MHELNKGYQKRLKIAVACAAVTMMGIGAIIRWSPVLIGEREITVRLTPYTDIMQIELLSPEVKEVTLNPVAPPEEPVEEKPPEQMSKIIPVPDWVEIEEELVTMAITEVADQLATTGLPGGTGKAATGSSGQAGPAEKPAGPRYDERPKVLKKVEPEYPPLAKMTGVEGVVVLLILINESGVIEEIEVVKSLGNTGCDEAAVNAVKQWHFAPAKRQGQPIAARVTLPVLFNLSTTQ